MKLRCLDVLKSACLCLLLAACLPAQAAAPQSSAVLTPYFTSTSPAPAATAAAPTETAQPAPTITPQPFTHEVTLQETISSIALRYGVSMDDIIAANPDIDPRTLTVGTLLIIPGISPVAQMNDSSEALPLEITDAACLPTPEGGLRCQALVHNPLDRPADGIIVAFTVTDPASGQSLRQNVPTLLNHIDPGGELPAVVYFAPPAPRAASVSVELISALSLESGIRSYVPVRLQNERVLNQGRSARATAQFTLPEIEDLSVGTSVNIWVAAVAYDAQGNLLGARRLERQLQVGQEGADGVQEFSLMVYSNSGEIDSLRLSVEAFIPDQ